MQSMIMLLGQTNPTDMMRGKVRPDLKGESAGDSLFKGMLSTKLSGTTNPKLLNQTDTPTQADLLDSIRSALLQLNEDELNEFLASFLQEDGEFMLSDESLMQFALEESGDVLVNVEALLGQLENSSTEHLKMLENQLQRLVDQKSIDSSWQPIDFQSVDRLFEQLQGIQTKEIDPNIMTKLGEKVTNLLQLVMDGESLEKVAPTLLGYLMNFHQWTEGNGAENKQLLPIEGNKQISAIWQDLVQSFQQKMDMHSKSRYPLESKVTTNDIVRWLGKALEARVVQDKPVSQTVPVNMPISRVEQFAIHIPQVTESQTSEKSFMEQFRQMIDTNKAILQQPKGQLAITLRPANLGEMLVRFTQINGETVVRIMVTTGIAKEMLEGNMQQLRHMFAPHQVVVERTDTATQQSTATEQEHAEEHEQENREQPSNGKEGRGEESNETFSSVFEEMILNEQV